MENLMTSTKENKKSTSLFNINDDVVYPLHGRCKIINILKMNVDGKTELFYKLETHRLGPVAKNQTKKVSSILLPVDNAEKRGLRKICTLDDANKSLETLALREDFFEYATPFYKIQSALELSLCNEGINGASKVLVYLHIRKNKDNTQSHELNRVYEQLYKAYTREIAEVLNQTVQNIEETVNKTLTLRSKQEGC